MLARHYTYKVSWNEESEEVLATCLEFPSISWLDKDSMNAFAGVMALVDLILDDMRRTGEAPPPPIRS